MHLHVIFSRHITLRNIEIFAYKVFAKSKVVQNNVLIPPPNFRLVFTEIVTDIIIGNVIALLNAHLPLLAKQTPTKFTLAKLAFHRIKAKQFTNISIILAYLNYKNRNFENHKIFVLVKLHFVVHLLIYKFALKLNCK